jgi:glycosyltransferase involved in cell wall biosynthesis
MKIAVVTPAIRDPERLFGAERHFAGMVNAFRERVDTEWVQVPVDESTWEAVLQSYIDCFELNLSRYDLVVSTKNPTFMVQHPHHVCWLLHQIRVFYDRFDDEYGSLPEHALAEKRSQRDIIRELDNAGFRGARKIFTNGYETARRLKHYNGYDAEVLHPPVLVRGHYCQTQEFFLLPGRLHRWKRVDLAIRAMRHYKGDLPLLIPGTGEDEPYFRELAQGDPRIHFLGFVSDEELLALYANALAVLFVPKDEDFGYITIEAMLSHKPVIVCTDSGEPARLVVNGETGFVVQPDPVEIAAAMSILESDHGLASRLGDAAFRTTPQQSWDAIVERLIEGADTGHPATSALSIENTTRSQADVPSCQSSVRVLVTDNQVLEPAVGGSRVRVKEICKGLAAHYQTEYIGAFDWPGPQSTDDQPLPTWHSRVFALSPWQYKLAAKLQTYVPGGSVIDVAFPWMTRLSKNFVNALRASTETSEVVVFTHPWAYPLCKDWLSGKVVIYDAHNFEWGLRSDLLSSTFLGRKLANSVKKVEGELVRRCNQVWACSQEDADAMSRVYGAPRTKFHLVPNCADTLTLVPANKEERSRAKQSLGWTGRRVAVFVGSGYRPNTEATAFIIENLAPGFPDVVFAIAGSVKEDYLRTTNAAKLLQVFGSARVPGYIGEGWYDFETWPDRTQVRWTAPQFTVEALAGGEELRLRLKTPQDNHIRVRQDQSTLYEGELPEGDSTITVQCQHIGTLQFELQREHRSPTDPRALGCAVLSLEWQRQGIWITLPLDRADLQALLPGNVQLLGVVLEGVLYDVLHAADIALNPVEMGSGTNLKLIQYMAAGLPVISTSAGIRGIERGRDVCAVAPLPAFPDLLKQMLESPDLLSGLGAAARAEAESNYDWQRVTSRAAKQVALLMEGREQRPFFSVVIPTYNRPDRLISGLTALTRQTFPDFEAVIVDQSDPPVQIPARFMKQLRIHYIHSTERGPALARNKGWRAATGDIVAFTDDDCVPDPNWLENAAQYFRERPIAGLEGLVRSDKIGDPRYRTVCNLGFEGIGYMTANMFYRRDVLAKVNGFDERFRFAFREDTDLAWRVLRHGDIPFAGDASVFHPPHSVDLERESPAERAKMFSVDPILLEHDAERYANLLFSEGHYRNTIGFWQHFVRGLDEHKPDVQVQELLDQLQRRDPDWWEKATAVADVVDGMGWDSADRIALRALILSQYAET